MHAAVLGCRPVAVMLLCLGLGGTAAADTRYEFWPELDVWFKLTDTLRLLAVGAGTRDRDSGERTNGETAAYLDYRMNDRISWRAGFSYQRDLADGPDQKDSIERRYVLDFNYRWRFGEAIQLTDRSRLDIRDLDDGTSYRVRNRLRIEREFKFSHTFVPYANVEAYYDSRYDTVSRVRIEAGSTIAFGKRYELDTYLGWQRDSQPKIQDVSGIGVTFNAHF
jgi:hypothetical protein